MTFFALILYLFQRLLVFFKDIVDEFLLVLAILNIRVSTRFESIETSESISPKHLHLGNILIHLSFLELIFHLFSENSASKSKLGRGRLLIL